MLNFIKTNTKDISMVLKYLFSILLTVYVGIKAKDEYYILVGGIELFLIFFLSNAIYIKYKAGYYFNSFLLFLYNVQMMVFVFGNSFITMMMLTNLDSIKALSGNAGAYISGVALIIIISLLPIRQVSLENKKWVGVFGTLIVIEIWMLICIGNWYSPVYGYVNLFEQYRMKQQVAREVALAANIEVEEADLLKTEFYKDTIEDHRKKDENLFDFPNVILIFTEGLSENVVSDEREITPNIKKWQKRSLSFENYYNHTFATYRGLNGQLYSAYQLGDIENNPLISLQSIFSDLGYATTFLNTEPENRDFTGYLENMGFDEVISNHEIQHQGLADSISDKDAYEMLYDLAEEKIYKSQPFFLSVYTFGTHASFDSVVEKYGDGKDPVLNRFRDMDAQFGNFMDKVNRNPNFNNTIVVFTTDHATYQDDPFISAFPKYDRFYQSFDKIPLFIYYKGIKPETIDANGRNSLNLAPTLLDYLDISAPNYFLGSSLFAKEASSNLETVYYDSVVTYSSEDGNMKEIEEGAISNIHEQIHRYFVTKALVLDE